MSTPDNVVSLCHTPSPTVIPVSSVHLQTRVWFLPGCHFSEQTKKRQNMPKLPAKHSPEETGGQFLMRMRRRGKRETARTSENIHPLKHLTHITEKSWARRCVKLLMTAELQLYCPQTPTPVALLYRTLHYVNKHKMAQTDSDRWEQSTGGHKGPQEGVRGCRKLKGRSAQDWGTAIYAPLIQVSGGAVRVRASNKTQTNPVAWHWSSASHNSIWVQLFWRRVVLLLWTPDFHFTWAVHSPLGLLRTDSHHWCKSGSDPDHSPGTEQPPSAQSALHKECWDKQLTLLFTALFKGSTCSLIYLILICIFLLILWIQRQSSLPPETSDRSASLSHLTATAGSKISIISRLCNHLECLWYH